MYPTDLTAQRLHKAFHAASNQASGAEKLFAHLQANGLPASLYATARAYCDQLSTAADQAAATYGAHAAPAMIAHDFAAAYEAQQRATGKLQAVEL